MSAAVPPGWPAPDDEPYTGPPPTGPYAAPPYVPGALPGVHAPPAAGTPGPGVALLVALAAVALARRRG